VLLLIAGVLALTGGGPDAMLSPHRRHPVVGGITGMIVFLLLVMVWLRESLWVR